MELKYPLLDLEHTMLWEKKSKHQFIQQLKLDIDILILPTFTRLVWRVLLYFFKHFYHFQNLEPLGEALREAISSGKVKRSELFLTTKIWPTWYGPGRVEASVRRQLSQSGLDQFDLVLLHWPEIFADDDVEGFPLGDNGKVKFGTRKLPEVYAELESVATAGLTRAIGVSNFNAAQLETILATAKIPPVMNQVEAHLYLAQKKLQTFCNKHNIAITAYCPLGAGGNKPNTFNVLEDPTLKALAIKYNKSPAQVALRYLTQRGIIVIPKSVRKERLESNFQLFDFNISSEDLSALEALDKGQRLVSFDYYGTKDGPNYPFAAEF